MLVTVWTDGYRARRRDRHPDQERRGWLTSLTERTLNELEASGRVVVRYLGGSPNGSFRDIAGISNEAGNVVGLMPHPEHAGRPAHRLGYRRPALLHRGSGRDCRA